MFTDGLLASAYVGDEVTSYTDDGVHPTANKGARYIGGLCAEYVAKLIK
jgi:hypothetical protein